MFKEQPAIDTSGSSTKLLFTRNSLFKICLCTSVFLRRNPIVWHFSCIENHWQLTLLPFTLHNCCLLRNHCLACSCVQVYSVQVQCNRFCIFVRGCDRGLRCGVGEGQISTKTSVDRIVDCGTWTLRPPLNSWSYTNTVPRRDVRNTYWTRWNQTP